MKLECRKVNDPTTIQNSVNELDIILDNKQ